MAELFSKLLTKTDVDSSLCIPSCSLGELPFEEGQTVNMHVHDDSGQAWIFPCSIRLDESSGRRFLSVGWLEFARDRDVRVGDQIIIHEETLSHPAITGSWMKIEVQGKIRLFCVDIWANLM